MNRLLPACLFALLLTGCDATIDSRTPADPTEQGAGGNAPAPPAPPGGLRVCVSCNDALAGDSGDICDDKVVDALEVCSEESCLDSCDDNLFLALSDPAKAHGCSACLDASCSPSLAACRDN